MAGRELPLRHIATAESFLVFIESGPGLNWLAGLLVLKNVAAGTVWMKIREAIRTEWRLIFDQKTLFLGFTRL